MTREPTSTLDLDSERQQLLHRREWIAERWGMVVIALIVTAALLGLLGPGPLSFRTATSSDRQLSIEHYSLQRYEAPAELVIRIRTPSANLKLIRLGISRTFTDHVTVEAMTPEPESTEMETDRLVYSFLASELDGDGKIIVRYKNDALGSVSYVVDAGEGTRAPVSHFVLP